MTEFDPISELINYFEENGWPLDINDNKLSDRASYEDHPNQQGYFVVEIERHRPILETRYRRGLSMSAFQTYWMRYAVHPRTKIVKELSEKMGEISIDMYGIVAEELEDGICLGIKPIGNNRYRIYDDIWKKEEAISTLQEAKSFVLSLSQFFVNYFKEYRLSESKKFGISKKQKDKLLSEYKKVLKEQMVYKVENLWEGRASYN